MKSWFLLLGLCNFFIGFQFLHKKNDCQLLNNVTDRKVSSMEARIYTTSKNTNLRLTDTGNKTFQHASQPLETEVAIFVHPAKTFQTFIGIGGAVTDATAEVFAALPQEEQQKFITSYFNPDSGIGYSLLRTSIHSCDFSSGSYTYVTNEDKSLSTFSIEHDQKYRIPLIKNILAAYPSIPVYASPWSPPAFMKDNKSMLKGGKLLPEFYDSWAMYYTKFIKAYEATGIPIWGITVQNEPMATQRWESCIYTAEEERDFLKNHLGPTMKREGYGDRKIIVWDHNRDLINHRADVIFSDPEAAKYAWGIGFHWYETWTGSDPMFNNVSQVNKSYPDKNLIFTEGCVDKFDSSKYQHWPNGELYGRSMINDFNAGTVAWTDWNILLDETGGPNHVQNFCFAPLHADKQKGELIFTPSYYYIGHFSKFIRPGARRISAVASRSSLMTTSFKNMDGSIATVVMNSTDLPVTYKLYIDSDAIEETIAAHSIQTVVSR
ncbi:MAG TPA: glycoside hydrolase family 30 protein [Saprospiraceae bacterium]|nr:glycoside hydrolase family 30 protein [Saprospiraceae bacterium]